MRARLQFRPVLRFNRTSRLRRCPNTTSRRCRPRAITGRRATGPGTTTIIIGCRASGSSRRSRASCGRRDTGRSSAASMPSIGAIGRRMSASTAASITATAMTGAATAAAAGTTGGFSTIRPSTISARLALPNVYSEPVPAPRGVGRASFNGGPGGILLKPTPEQERLTTEEHVRPTPLQVSHAREASVKPEQFNATNKGRPAIAATPRPGDFKGEGVVPARAAGAAETVPPTGPNGHPPAPNGGLKEEQKLPQPPAGQLRNGALKQTLPGENPIKPEPLNAPKLEPKLPASPVPPPVPSPNGAQKPQEKLPGASPNGVIRPPGFDKPVNVRAERDSNASRVSNGRKGWSGRSGRSRRTLARPTGFSGRRPASVRPRPSWLRRNRRGPSPRRTPRSLRATSSGCSPSRAASPFADSRACRRARSEKYKGRASVLPCSSAGRPARLTSRFRRSPRPGAGERGDSPRSRGLRSPRASRSRSTVRERSC